RLSRQQPPRLPARLHLPDLRRLWAGHAFRRRQADRRPARSGPCRRFCRCPPRGRTARYLRRVRRIAGTFRQRSEIAHTNITSRSSTGGVGGCKRRPMTSRPETPLLDTVPTPEQLRKLERKDLRQLATELRAEMIDTVSTTGGHLGAGL